MILKLTLRSRSFLTMTLICNEVQKYMYIKCLAETKVLLYYSHGYYETVSSVVVKYTTCVEKLCIIIILEVTQGEQQSYMSRALNFTLQLLVNAWSFTL